MSDWIPPRCIHGHILLGCPHDDCPTQLAYLDQQNAALRDWDAAMWRLLPDHPHNDTQGEQG